MRDGVEASGEFVEVDPPRRLVFTWGWSHDPAVPPGATRVVVTLEPENGGTRVVLRHHGLPDDGQRAHHRKGWELYLGRLGQRIRGQRSRPGPQHLTAGRIRNLPETTGIAPRADQGTRISGHGDQGWL
jgi:hypothetical protein